jgi:hypothetical protein
MNINLESLTAKTGGNLFDSLSALGKRMEGFGQVQRQAAIAALFGTYQYNRLNVALDNLGRGLSGVAGTSSQVASALEIMGQGSESWAETASQEIQVFQQSLSGRFTRTIQTIKAEMAELGKPILGVLVPILGAVGNLISAFNELPGPIKGGIMAFFGFAAVGGVLIMLAGLFGNLFGQALKLASSAGQLVTRFKVMTPVTQAAALAAKRMSASFNTEMAATEALTLQVTNLTNAMTRLNKQQMIQAGYKVNTNNRGGYAAYDPQGNRIPKADAIRMGLIEQSATRTQQQTAQTTRNIGKWAAGAAGLGVSVLAFSTMVGSSHSIMENMIGIALIASSINFSGLGAGLSALAVRGGGGALGVIKGLGTKIKELALLAKTSIGGMATRIGAGFTGAFAGVSKIRGVMNLLISPAARLFGPVGLLAGGAAAAYLIYQNMTKVQRAQENINKSTDAWSEMLGYVKDVGKATITEGGPGQANNYSKNAAAVAELTSKNEDLVDSLKDAAAAGGDFNKVYGLALQEAMKVKLTGGSVENAKQAFLLSLQAAGLDEMDISQLMVKFEKVDLENPAQMVEGILTQVQGAFDDAMANGGGSFTPSGFSGWVSGIFGGDVTDEGRAAGMRAGQLFALGLMDAQQNGNTKAANDLALGMVDDVNEAFQTQFGAVQGNNKELFEKWGITTADQLYEAIQDAKSAWKANGYDYNMLTDAQRTLLTDLSGETEDFANTYGEQMDVIYHAIGQTIGASEDQIQGWIDRGVSYAELMGELGAGVMSATDAQKQYDAAITGMGREYNNYTDQQKLDLLNQYRLNAGLGLATSLMQGFGNAMDGTTSAAGGLLAELTALENIDTSELTSDQLVDMTKNTFQDAQSSVMSGAADLAKKQQQAEQDAIQRSGDRRQAALDARGKANDKAFEAENKALRKAQDAETKVFDKAWDTREKAAEDYFDGLETQLDNEIDAVKDAADARVDAINSEIDAMDEADDERDKMFEREKKRIERMAELKNGNIDFNQAINSGNVDEAARLMNTQSAKVQGWNVEDQQTALGEASDKKKKGLKSEIEQIEAVRDAQVEALEARKDALKESKEFRLAQLKEEREGEQQALKDRQEEIQEELASRKEAAAEALQNAKQSATQDTQNRIAANNAQYESRKTTLDQELATITASVPRTKAEYDKQVAQIQEAYRKYGVDLTAQGTAWSGVIGGSLTAAVAKSSAGLVNDIAWGQYGAMIAAAIEGGAKISMADLQQYLKTGVWPGSTAPGQVTRTFGEGRAVAGNGIGTVRIAHSGGRAGGSSNMNWSQADRVGVPRSASLYPTEIPTILKQGEFVVNARSARKNMGILSAINDKGFIPGSEGLDQGGWAKAVPQPVFRHAGGMMNSVGLAYGMAYGQALEDSILDSVVMKIGLTKKAKDNAGMASGYNGPISGNINNVLSVARSQVGKPYIWGGAGPSGSDCSGFMSIIQNAVQGASPKGNTLPYGRRWATASFGGGKEIDGWKRGGTASDVFRIGVEPGSHTAGTFAGINVESGSGHGPMVGGRALGANDKSFSYRYYLPAANQLPGLRTGGNIMFDNTLANLHKGETVLTAPLTQAFQDNVASGGGNEYNVKVEFNGPVNSEIDVERAIRNAMDKAASKNGRKRVIS